jgi:hypothetical protein
MVGTFYKTKRASKLMKFKNWLLHNFLSKLLSLLIAFSLWFFVVFENMPEVTFIVPLRVKNQPRNMAMVENMEGKEIEVRLKGPQAIMTGLTVQQVETTIDLSSIGTGETVIPLTPDVISVPRQVKVVGISPASVIIELEPITSRMVAVEPVILGVPADGYLLKEVRVFPEQVKVFGAKSVLEKLKSFSTESVDIGGANKPLTAKVHIIPLERNIRLANSNLVEVRPIIVEKEVDQEFQAVPIIVIPPGMKATLNPDRVNVILHGIKSKLAQLKPEDLVATVNSLDLPEEKNWVTPKLSLPEEISLVKVIPEQIEVTAVSQEEGDELLRPKPGQPILPQKTATQPKAEEESLQKKTTQEVTFSVPLKIKNQLRNVALADGLEGKNVEIRLVGPQSVMSQITAQQLEVVIDISDFDPGEITLPLTPDIIHVPHQVKVLGISPSSVTVKLEPIVSRLIKVDPVVLGVPAEGYLLKEVRVFPDQIKVFGGKKVLEGLKTFSTESVDIDGTKKSLTAKVHITFVEKNIRLADGDMVEVRPIIVEKEDDREFRSIPIIVIPPGSKVILTPPRVDVFLHGARSKLSQIKPEDLVATANFQDLPEGENRVRPKISLPEGITLAKIIPAQVEIKSTVPEKEEDREFRGIPIVVTPPGMRVMLNPPRVDVLLHGTVSKLAQIKPKSLVATINFNDMPKGINRAVPKIALPKGITLVKITPDQVNVNTVTVEKNGNPPKSETKP